MTAIEDEMQRLGDISSGPGHYALGRGWLTLHDDAAARRHLELAMKMDYRRPGVSYALGMALGRLYQRELTIARRIENDALRNSRVAEIERDLRDPALELLRTGENSVVEAPQYAEALISFYGGHLEEALSATRAAFLAEEWLYEAKLLEADILVEMAAEMRLNGNADGALDTLAEADQAYDLAADIARSDPSIHSGQCETSRSAWKRC